MLNFVYHIRVSCLVFLKISWPYPPPPWGGGGGHLHMLGVRGCAARQGVLLRACVLSGYTFLPIFLVCVLSGVLFNLLVSYVFPQVQSQGCVIVFYGQGQVVLAAQLRQSGYAPPQPPRVETFQVRYIKDSMVARKRKSFSGSWKSTWTNPWANSSSTCLNTWLQKKHVTTEETCVDL